MRRKGQGLQREQDKQIEHFEHAEKLRHFEHPKR
jgi:hypothetical protein